MRVVLLGSCGVIIVFAACGGSASDDTADSGAMSSSGSTTIVAPVPGTDAEVSGEAIESTTGGPASSGATESLEPVPSLDPANLDPADLDPGTATVVVDGVEFRFARGDSMFDVCDLSPDFDLVAVEMDLADGSAEGSRHLVFNDDSTGQLLTIGIPPDVGFIAGVGEEIDRYAQFDVDPPPLGPTEVGSGTAVGTSAMVDVFSGETVQASFAIRCE